MSNTPRTAGAIAAVVDELKRSMQESFDERKLWCYVISVSTLKVSSTNTQRHKLLKLCHVALWRSWMNSSFLSSTRVFFPSFYIHNPSGASCRGASSLPLSFFMVGVVFCWHQTFNTISQMLHLNLIRPKKILSLYTVRVFHLDLRQMLVLMSFTVSFFFLQPHKFLTCDAVRQKYFIALP